MSIDKRINEPYGLDSLIPNSLAYLKTLNTHLNTVEFRKKKLQYSKVHAQTVKESHHDYQYSYVKSVSLKKSEVEFNDSIVEALFERTSRNDFHKKQLSFDQLSFLLLFSAGSKDSEKFFRSSRMYPSGGALFSTRLYVDVRNVEGLEPGIWLFNPLKESLDLINDNVTLQDRLFMQNESVEATEVENSCLQFFITTRMKYGAEKYTELYLKLGLLECGHIMQNVALLTSGLNLIGYPSCTLDPLEGSRVLRTDPQCEFLVYSYALGFSK